MFLVFPLSMKRLGQDSVQVSSHLMCHNISHEPSGKIDPFYFNPGFKETLLLDESWFLPVTFSEGLFCGKR